MFCRSAAKVAIADAGATAGTGAGSAVATQFDGGMVFPGEVAAPFDQTFGSGWRTRSSYNQRPIDEVLAEYETNYDELLANTNFWITPEA